MTDSKFMVALIEKYWPTEFDVAGRTNVVDIVEDSVVFSNAEGGSWIDSNSAIVSVTAIVGLLKVCIEVYEKLKVHLGRTPEKSEVKQEVVNRLSHTDGPKGIFSDERNIDKSVLVICDEMKNFAISTDSIK